ncbi:zinc ribbon domain-containing protein [Cohnella mopanensis]|uniref:zinc ribbon domain-containing protein n=1 Tax=Cohnella mopanensis TaxID=2911966 RepID=UPI001EF7EF08|nr:zinc ribbon domain-containing protein [Cohnella mopanensis]
MFCSNCGNQISEHSKFCNHCGVAVPDASTQGNEPAIVESAAAAEVLQQPQSDGLQPIVMRNKSPAQPDEEIITPMAKTNKLRPIHWIMPLACLVVSVALITGLYFYHKNINRNVENLLQEGEKMALEGKWSEGLESIETALKKRPDHPVLLKDQAVLTEAISFEKQLIESEQQSKQMKYDQATKTIHTLKEQLNSRTGPLIDQLNERAGKQEELIVVSQINQKLSATDKLDELFPLFNAIKEYRSDEATKTNKAIKAKIFERVHEKAMSELKANNFNLALTTVEEGLKLDDSNKKMVELKQTIETKKKKFEQDEAERIQKAREAASLEDQKNKTDAVDLIFASGYYEEETGNYNVEINVKNVATRPISSVLIYYDLLDEYGDVVDSSSAYVLPDNLDVGKSGTAYNYHYSDGSISSVQVTYFEWYIN